MTGEFSIHVSVHKKVFFCINLLLFYFLKKTILMRKYSSVISLENETLHLIEDVKLFFFSR